MDSEPGNPDDKKNPVLIVLAACAVAAVNAIFAFGLAIGIGMSTLPPSRDPFYFLGVHESYLPHIFLCSAPAAVLIFLLLRKTGRRKIALVASSTYFIGICIFLFWVFAVAV